MPLYECPHCYHLQDRKRGCELCEWKGNNVAVPTPEELAAATAKIRDGWTKSQREKNTATAYRAYPWEIPTEGPRSGRVCRKPPQR
jgi:hypothetical protein